MKIIPLMGYLFAFYKVTELNEKSEENGTATRQRSTQGAVVHADVKAEDSGKV